MRKLNVERCLHVCVLWGALQHATCARAADGNDFPAADQSETISVHRLASVHAKGVAHLRAVVGRERTEQLLAAAAGLGAGFQVVAACVGSFDRPGRSQVILGLVTTDLSKVIYAAFLNDSEPRLLLQENPGLDERGVLQRIPSARCLSWTAIERENSRRLAVGALETVKRRSFMDVACVAPIRSDWEYLCHAFDDKRREWVRIGGWPQP